MRARTCLPPCLRLCLSLAAVWCGLPTLAAEEVIPLAVRGGLCEVVLPAKSGETFYLILGSLSAQPGPHRITVRTEPTRAPFAVPRAPAVQDYEWSRLVDDLAERQAHARGERRAPEKSPPQSDPPRRKVFHIFMGDQDFKNPAEYAAIQAEFWAVGKQCQVYVDRDHRDHERLQATANEVTKTFDEGIYPKARQWLGRCRDVDGDGRFTILLSDRLSRLQGGKVSLGGFVRGSDFYRDLAAPISNACDMMYLNANLKPGPHLRTLLAHEYTHAVIFSEHVFGEYLPVAGRHDEESWLNEGLAHVVEDLHGHSWSNLDYRVSAFLSDPQRYGLVVPDYYGTGVWRTPGTRGVAYLFLRWCLERCGDELPARLTQSNLQGVLNLETATRRRFAELFREWSAALLLSGSGASAEDVTWLRRPDLRRPLASRLLCGPRFEEVPLDGANHEVRLAGTGVAFLLLHSPAGPRTRVTITADAATDLQVSLVRRSTTARLSLRCERASDGKTVRLTLTAHGTAVKLDEAAWERLLPEGQAHDTSYRPGKPPGRAVRAWFGGAWLAVEESRRSGPIALPAISGGIVFKVTATDDEGQRVAAWAVLER